MRINGSFFLCFLSLSIQPKYHLSEISNKNTRTPSSNFPLRNFQLSKFNEIQTWE